MKKLSSFFLIIPLIMTSCSNSMKGISFWSSSIEYVTYYDDSYFLLDNNHYHQEIAVASYANVMSGFDLGTDYQSHGRNFIDILNKEGFKGIYLNDVFFIKPTMDSIGYGFAYKTIEDFNLISITIRSGSYGAEWANNVTVGKEGHAKGFYDSSNIVLEALSTYISDNNLKGKTKLWISGYSRGAAITNLMAATILQNINEGICIGDLVTTKDDIYAYCFEPPAAACTTREDARSSLYSGIHCIFNFNDMVPMTLGIEWGFVHYGQIHYYPDRITDIYFNYSERQKLVTNFHFQNGSHNMVDYAVDDWKFYDVGEEAAKKNNLPREVLFPSQGLFAKNLSHKVFGNIIPRELYDHWFQESFRNLFGAFFGYYPGIEEVSLDGNKIVDAIVSYPLFQVMVDELRNEEFGAFALDLEYIFYIVFDGDVETIKSLYNTDFFFFIIYLTTSAFKDREDLLLQFFSRDNLLNLIPIHYAEINYSFLLSCDTRLYGDKACKLNDGSYRVLHVKTPNSISLHETHLRKNVFSYFNGVMSSDTLSAEKLADGSINIYLPKNGIYQYQIDSPSISLGFVNEYGEETIIQEYISSSGTI